MHMLLSRPWRHRLLAAHVAAGAGMLGAGVALLAWHGSLFAGAGVTLTLLIAHLALLAVVFGVVAFTRRRYRVTGGAAHADSDRAASHRTTTEE